MAGLRPGNISGYQFHGTEKRADAGHPKPGRIGGTPRPGGQHPALSVKPLMSPGKPVDMRAEITIFRQHVQKAQFQLGKAGVPLTSGVSPDTGP